MKSEQRPGGEKATTLRYNLIEMAETMSDVVSLGRGDPDLHTPAPIVEAAVRSMPRLVGPPPVRGLERLRSALAQRYQQDKQLGFDPEREILVTNGGQEALFLTMLALVDPGDRVLVADPRYTSYDQAIEAAGGTIVSLLTDQAHDFELDPDEVARHAEGAKLLILINPNNPTSTLLPPDKVRAIAEVARRAGVVVISDEIYESLVFDGGTVQSVAACEGMRGRTITLSGFSKTYAMTGFRLGYLVGPEPFIDAAARVKAVTSGPTPLISQYAGLAALEGSQEMIDELPLVFDRRRRLMMQGLDRLKIPYSRPGGAFYIWANISRFGLPAEEFCRRLLLEARVLMFPGTSFGARWTDYVRISLLQPEARLSEALARIGAFVESITGGQPAAPPGSPR